MTVAAAATAERLRTPVVAGGAVVVVVVVVAVVVGGGGGAGIGSVVALLSADQSRGGALPPQVQPAVGRGVPRAVGGVARVAAVVAAVAVVTVAALRRPGSGPAHELLHGRGALSPVLVPNAAVLLVVLLLVQVLHRVSRRHPRTRTRTRTRLHLRPAALQRPGLRAVVETQAGQVDVDDLVGRRGGVGEDVVGGVVEVADGQRDWRLAGEEAAGVVVHGGVAPASGPGVVGQAVGGEGERVVGQGSVR